MNLDQRVDARDLEDASDARIRHDDVEAIACLVSFARGHGEDTHPGRIEERAGTQIDDDPRARRKVAKRRLEVPSRRQIQVAGDVHHDGAGGRLFDPYVKIARRGHERRV